MYVSRDGDHLRAKVSPKVIPVAVGAAVIVGVPIVTVSG